MARRSQRSSRMLVELISGEIYESVFHEANDNILTVRKVSRYPNGLVHDFIYKFFANEIRSVTAILVKGEELCSDKVAQHPVVECTLNLKQYIHLMKKAAHYTYLPVCDNVFCSAINRIKQVDIIAVNVEDDKYYRSRNISILSISTKSETFVFDLKIAGSRPIEMGLKEIFEAQDILKIVYDSRHFAYCLWHRYQIKLNNVFDPKATDILLRRQRIGLHVLSLKARRFDECVTDYLQLPRQTITSLQYRYDELQPRPLSEKSKMALALKAAYLFALRSHMDKIIFEKFTKACNCSMNSLRCKCDRAAEEHMDMFEISDEFLRLRVNDYSLTETKDASPVVKQQNCSVVRHTCG